VYGLILQYIYSHYISQGLANENYGIWRGEKLVEPELTEPKLVELGLEPDMMDLGAEFVIYKQKNQGEEAAESELKEP